MTSNNARVGYSVSFAGDINGDSISDFLVSADTIQGTVFVIYGSTTGFSCPLNLTTLNSTQGFPITNVAGGGSFSGNSVSGIGDFNHDTLDDIIIGAPQYNSDTGAAYIIYGKLGGYTSIDVNSLSSSGLIINGVSSADYAGSSVRGIGDINSDGINDVIIGAPLADSENGAAYVVYGGSNYGNSLNLGTLPSSSGFVMTGVNNDDFTGFSVSPAGDLNGDGVGDLLIGAKGKNMNSGSVYLVYGNRNGYTTLPLNSGGVVRFDGAVNGDNTGFSVSALGDVNMDSSSDFIIGAPGYNSNTGAAFVVYGQTSGYSSPFSLASLTSSQGFIINGATAGDQFGSSVSAAEDVNKDGIMDIIIGAPQANNYTGAAYIIYGRSGGYNAGVNVASLSSSEGIIIYGNNNSYAGNSVSVADINKDGNIDIIVGGRATSLSNAAYVIYGPPSLIPILGTSSSTVTPSTSGINSNTTGLSVNTQSTIFSTPGTSGTTNTNVMTSSVTSTAHSYRASAFVLRKLNV